MQPPSSPTSVKLEIGGQFFYLGLKYKEGDVITAAEAAALDKARADNIRNIFAKTVREAKEDEDLQAAFAKLAVEYTFTRLLPKSSFDPVEKIANSIATDLANELLRSRNISKSSLLEGKFEEIVQEILHANPAIMEEAQERHKAIKSLAKGLRLVAG